MTATLWMLTFVNLICYLDRYIISSVASKVAAEFSLNHAETGMFMSIFMVGYMLTSPIFGFYGDRKSRPILMGIGVFLWSIATLASGLSETFMSMLLARMAVGVGEASFATLAPPFIRDSLRDEAQVNRILGIFYVAIPVGAALGFGLGGALADMYHWRWAFYVGSVPGFVLTYHVMTMKEPSFRVRDVSELSLVSGIKTLMSNRDFKLTVWGYTAQTFALGGFSAWAPQYGEKILGVSATESGLKIGACTAAAGLLGTLLGGKLGNIFLPKDAEKSGVVACQAFNKFCAWTSVVATPLAYYAFKASSFNEFVIILFVVQLVIFAALSPVNTAILASVSSKIASTAFAVSIFFIHILGDVISPPLVGWLSDRMPMPQAMNILVFALALSAVFWFYGGKAHSEPAVVQASA